MIQPTAPEGLSIKDHLECTGTGITCTLTGYIGHGNNKDEIRNENNSKRVVSVK